MKAVKKFFSVALCVVLIFSSMAFSVFAEGEATEPLLGDVDGDGKVDTVDARTILRMAAGIEYIDGDILSVADMDADGIVAINDAVLALRKATNIGGVVIPDKNGDNFLSDDPTNEFIKLIADKYDLDPASLVAIYSVPDSGTNYVLEFKGSGILGNKPPFEKSVDNLKKVYQIGLAPERKIAYTDGKLVLGDHYNCEAAEGVLVFNLVQSMVMEQYPDYFSGTGK
ncbi:MAG: hypothetical protein E7533_01810 [Ruminococcaceae bacterium]|nr:hypothetical protein [Oscillospiraceae bacterium]